MNKQQEPVLFTRIKPVNKKFITKMSIKTGRSQKECVDAILDSIRLKRDVKITPKKSYITKKAEAVKIKKKKKLAAI